MKFYSKTTMGFYDDGLHSKEQIPSDAVEVSDESYAKLFSDQCDGKIIQPDGNGNPQSVSIMLSGNDLIKSQISTLEISITPRRRDEAILGQDSGWLSSIRSQIATLRAQLK